MRKTIALGGRHFELQPLKLGQLRLLLDALQAMEGKSGGGLIEAAAGIVAAGLAPAHSGLSRDDVLDLEASVDELNLAVAAILRIAGLRPPDAAPASPADAAPGEVVPVAGPGEAPAGS